jgi:hypothetical protein
MSVAPDTTAAPLTQSPTGSSSPSREETIETPPSPSHTAVDVSQHGLATAEKKWERSEEAPFKNIAEEQARKEGPAGAELKLGQKRKWFLLFIFSVAQYLDIASYSGLFGESAAYDTKRTRLMSSLH